MLQEITRSIKLIRSDFEGFSQIASLFAEMKPYQFTVIHMNLSQMDWCDGNMCAPLGAVLYSIARAPNQIELSKARNTKVEELLCKNGFLTNYGRVKREDIYGSTIQYQRFEPHEDRAFGYYIDEQFRNKAIPEMSVKLHKKFLEALMEIFSNATIHSETKQGIFVCGQYFHRQQRLDFTIADLGIGIRRSLLSKINLDLSSEQAIQWAVDGHHTTKRGSVPGGLGLKLLREFIELNKGRLQIVSDRGYWEQVSNGQVKLVLMESSFPGTVVNVEINTADDQSYLLTDEIRETEIPF